MTCKEQLMNEVKAIADELNGSNYEETAEYFDDVLDIRYTIDASGRYLGAVITVALSPNIYVDTLKETVRGYCGNDVVVGRLDFDALNNIDNYFESCYEAVR